MRDFLPPFGLEKGDTLGAYSPSDALIGERALRIERGVDVLREAGFAVRFGRNAFAKRGVSAGSPEEREEDIVELVGDPCVRGLIATHGGKSCIDLINVGLPWELLRIKRKPILGFSDVSILLNAVTAKTGLITFYGPNVLSRITHSRWADLRSLTTGSQEFCSMRVLQRSDATAAVKPGTAIGQLFGGNLECFVYGLIVTGFDLSAFHGGIFFWESSGMSAASVYQSLTALSISGFLGKIEGMIIGDAFLEQRTDRASRDENLLAVALACAEHKFPILYMPVFGHRDDTDNPIIPIGCLAKIVAEDGLVELMEPYVVRR